MATQTAEKGKTPLPAKTGTPAPTGPPSLAMQSKSIVDAVEARIQQFIRNGQLDMPKDYSVDNALKSAWLILQTTEDKDHNKALTVCTRDSVANALLDMVVQGLNPGKKQGYFIVYGKSLTFQRSYFGSMAVAKMVNPKIDDFAFAVVYEGDTFKYGIEHGKKSVITHEQSIENVKKENIVAAYCIALKQDGTPFKTEIMTYEEIKQAWHQSKMNPFDDQGNVKASSTHGKFTADMALKTVINKTCKTVINASSDNALLLERINRNEDLADAAATAEDIDEHANTGEVLQIENQGPEGTGVEVPGEQQVICVCGDMTAQKMTEWTCPVHGTYQGGKFAAQKRAPGF